MRTIKILLVIATLSVVSPVYALSLKEIPSDIPKTDLDLYIATQQIKLGDKATVPPITLPDIPGFKPITLADLPDFNADVEKKISKSGKVSPNGLLATINYAEYEGRKVEGAQKVKLATKLTGFKEEISVITHWQAGKAPLAVILLGFGQSAEDKNARSWQADLYNAGNHVLCFDSIIRNNMNQAFGHGVAGNPKEEGPLCADIVEAILSMKDHESGKTGRDRVSSVRLVGFSYGGNLLLQILRDSRVNNWPVDRGLIVSTPVDFLRTSQLFDYFNLTDQTHFSKFSLAKLLNGFTPSGDEPTERELSLLRAGLGYSFHGDKSLIFANNLKQYMPDLKRQLTEFSNTPEVTAHRKQQLERVKLDGEKALAELEAKQGTMDKKQYETEKRDLEEWITAKKIFAGARLDDVGQWTFKHGRFLLYRPFWDIKGDYSDFGRLKEMLKGAPNYVQVVISEDDPLNLTEDLQALKDSVKEPRLLMIPHGGHVGISGTKWFQALMEKFFNAR